MPSGHDLEVTRDLSEALTWVLSKPPEHPDHISVLAAYLDTLARGFGLAGTDPDGGQTERMQPPAAARTVLDRFLSTDSASLDEGRIGDLLCEELVALSQDVRARKLLNKTQPLTDVEVLLLGQIYWNLISTNERQELPLRPRTTPDGRTLAIEVRRNVDFAELQWAERMSEGTVGLGRQGTLRKKGARLTTLIAERIVKGRGSVDDQLPKNAARFTYAESLGGKRQIASIRWREEPPFAAAVSTRVTPSREAVETSEVTSKQAHASILTHSLVRPVLRKLPSSGLQGRDRQLEELSRFSSSDRDRRLLLAGSPHSGKSSLLAGFFAADPASSALLLGYFVPWNSELDAQWEAMVASLIRQARRIVDGVEYEGASTNPVELAEVLTSLVEARQDREVVVIVDGVDEDKSRSGSITSVLEDLSESVSGLKLIVSAASGWGAVSLAWRRLELQSNEFVEENLDKMSEELEGLYGSQDSSGRRVLQLFTFESGAFTPGTTGGTFSNSELEELAAMSAREVERILSHTRIFSQSAGSESGRWEFAHREYKRRARGLFPRAKDAEADTTSLIDTWVGGYRAAEWPMHTPRYILDHYSDTLANRSDLDGLCALLFDAKFLRVVARTAGPSNVIPRLAQRTLTLAIAAANNRGGRDSLERVVKLSAIRDNFQPAADMLPLVLLEAVSAVYGRAEAARLGRHIQINRLSYSQSIIDMLREPERGICGVKRNPLVGALARAGLTSSALAQIYADVQGSEESFHVDLEWARILIEAGEVSRAVELLPSIEPRIDEDWYPEAAEEFATLAMLYHQVGKGEAALAVAQRADAYFVKHDFWQWGEGPGPVLAAAELFLWAGRTEDARSMLQDLEWAEDLYTGATIDEAFLWGRGEDAELADILRELPVPVTNLLRAARITGHTHLSRELMSRPLAEAESLTVRLAWMLAAGMIDEAFSLVKMSPRVLVNNLGIDREDVADHIDDIAAFTAYFLGLIACTSPDKAIADGAADRIEKLISSSRLRRPGAMLTSLSRSLSATGRHDRLAEILPDLDDPGEALAYAVETLSGATNLHDQRRFVYHEQWQNPRAWPDGRIRSLARLALCQQTAGDRLAAREEVQDALRLAANPLIVADVIRQSVVTASTGHGLDLELLKGHRAEVLFLGIFLATAAVSDPGNHLESLRETHRLVTKDWTALNRVMVDAGTGRGLFSPLGRRNGWPRVFLGFAEAFAGADERADAADSAATAVDLATQRDPRTLDDYAELAQTFATAARLRAFEFHPELVDALRSKLRLGEDRESFRVKVYSSFAEAGVVHYAAFTAANSTLLASLGFVDEARIQADDAATLLTSTTADEGDASGTRDRGIASCIATLSLLGEAGRAAPFLGFISSPGIAATAHSYLAQGFSRLGDTTMAVKHASTALEQTTWITLLSTIRSVDPTIIAAVGGLEKELWFASMGIAE